MGRPIKQSYFLRGGKNPSDLSFNATNGGPWSGVSMTVGTAGTHYPVGTTITIAQGQLGAESQSAAATLSINTTTGAISGITVTEVGSGYNAAPTYTINQPVSVTSTVNGTGPVTATNTFTVGSTVGISVGMLIAGARTGSNGYVRNISTGNVITSSVTNNGTWTNLTNLVFSSNGASGVINFTLVTPADAGKIATSAWIVGDSQARTAAIVKQEASNRYLVEAKSGGYKQGQCKLVAAAPAAGQMTIVAKDSLGYTYYVTKLTARKCRIIAFGAGAHVYTTGTTGIMARWTLGWANAVGTDSTASGTSVGIETNTN